MTIRWRGSQGRERLEDTPYEVVPGHPHAREDCVVLEDQITGQRELWAMRDDFAGYVIEINGVGYEFVRSI